MLNNSDRALRLFTTGNLYATWGGTATGVSHAKGVWGPSDPSVYDFYGFMLSPHINNSGKFLFDYGIGPDADKNVILSNLLIHAGGTQSDVMQGAFYVPLAIPAGSIVAIRGQGDGVSVRQAQGALIGFSSGSQLPVFGRCTTYGVTETTTSGTLLDSGGVAHTAGAYVEVSASIERDIKWLILAVGLRGNTAATSAVMLVEIAIGPAGSEIVVASFPFGFAFATTEIPNPSYYSVPLTIPAGTRVSARSTATIIDATDRLIEVGLYGFD